MVIVSLIFTKGLIAAHQAVNSGDKSAFQSTLGKLAIPVHSTKSGNPRHYDRQFEVGEGDSITLGLAKGSNLKACRSKLFHHMSWRYIKLSSSYSRAEGGLRADLDAMRCYGKGQANYDPLWINPKTRIPVLYRLVDLRTAANQRLATVARYILVQYSRY